MIPPKMAPKIPPKMAPSLHLLLLVPLAHCSLCPSTPHPSLSPGCVSAALHSLDPAFTLQVQSPTYTHPAPRLEEREEPTPASPPAGQSTQSTTPTGWPSGGWLSLCPPSSCPQSPCQPSRWPHHLIHTRHPISMSPITKSSITMCLISLTRYVEPGEEGIICGCLQDMPTTDRIGPQVIYNTGSDSLLGSKIRKQEVVPL